MIYQDLYEQDLKIMLSDCLMAMRLLKCYPTESQLAGTFRVNEKTARTKCWNTIASIQGLKKKKVSIYFTLLLYCLYTNSLCALFRLQ